MTREEALNRIDAIIARHKIDDDHVLLKGVTITSLLDYDALRLARKLLEQEHCTDAISRQAAIDLADELKDDLPDDDRLSDMVMSHNEGILEYQTKLSLLPSVTPAEKQESCEDFVSRKELLKIYEDRFLELQKIKHLKDNKGAEDRQMGVNYCINILKEMTYVTPLEKVGHWFVDERPESDREIICSNCEQPIFKYHKMNFDYRPNFCPNCGTKMREVGE